jgi:hypothetical protein
MNRKAFVKRVAVVGGFLFLCATPRLGFGQSTAAGAAPVARARAAAKRNLTPSDLLTGLTLTDEQKAKINQIREDTKSRLAVVAKDQKLGPEVKDAMAQGYLRIENTEIFAVLTLDQQREVRKRISDSKASVRPGQQQLQQPAAPQTTPQASKRGNY